MQITLQTILRLRLLFGFTKVIKDLAKKETYCQNDTRMVKLNIKNQ